MSKYDEHGATRQYALIEYQVKADQGTEIVYCEKSEDIDIVLNRCKAQLRRKYGDLPKDLTRLIIKAREDVKD